MRLLQVMAGAETGGAETAFVDMCIALHQTGIQQHIITRANPVRVPRLIQAGLSVTTLPFGGTFDLYTPWKIQQQIRQFRPDIVQTWMSRAAQKTPKCRSNASHRYLKICRLGGYYKLKYFKGADYFTTITPDIKRHLITCGVDENKIFHINNFADVEEPQQIFNRANLKTPENAPLIVTLGRLHRAKAFDTLIEALVQIPEAYLWIGGDGPDLNDLENLTSRLGVKDRVRFLGWVTDRAALLRAGDVCVFPSRYEPFGTVFIQAWAQKIPLISSNADGPRQYVRDGIDGLIFEIDNVDQLVQAIKKLFADPKLATELVKAGHERFEQEFTRHQTVQAYLDLYHTLLKETRNTL